MAPAESININGVMAAGQRKRLTSRLWRRQQWLSNINNHQRES
jgi:hypothetical protein